MNMNKRQIIIISISILVLAAVVGSVFYYLVLNKADKKEEPAPTTMDRKDYDVYPKGEENPHLTPQTKENLETSRTEYSHDYIVMEKAISTNKKKYCQKLENTPISKCYYDLAITNHVEKYCKKIKDKELKQRCQEQFDYKRYVQEGDYKNCKELEYFKNQCLMNIYKGYSDLNQCKKFQGMNRKLCLDVIYKNKAFEQQDKSLCEKIINKGMKYDCVKIVESNIARDSDGDGIKDKQEINYGINPYSADTDGDGLKDKEEAVQYHTDPTKKDTDGDGYSDGEEIMPGYDPLGEGKLE